MTDDTWTVAVEIPARLPEELKDSLFTAVADAAHDWEPKTRDGWDVHVTGYPTPHGAGWAEAAVERVRVEHAAIHADMDAFEAVHNPACECEIAPTSRNVADRMLLALDPPSKET